MAQKVKKLVCWVDSHPRTGWYVAVVVTINFALNFWDKVAH